MTSEPGPDVGPSFCGNCGARMDSESQICGACGQPANPPFSSTETAPRDYIPYCRNCGVGVPWGRGHSCQRCGVAPLCDLHFRSASGLCLDCADAPTYSGGAIAAGGLRCNGCGMFVAPLTDFCPNCGLGMAAPYVKTEYMGFWIRFAAFVADWIIAYVVAALVAAVIGISLTSGDVDPEALADISIAIENFNYSFLFLFSGISALYCATMTALTGQTLGKMLLRIQVVDSEGNVPPWHKSVARELLRGIFLLALFPLGLLYVWVALDARKRGPHDHLFGCYVVRKTRNTGQPRRF